MQIIGIYRFFFFGGGVGNKETDSSIQLHLG